MTFVCCEIPVKGMYPQFHDTYLATENECTPASAILKPVLGEENAIARTRFSLTIYALGVLKRQ